MATRAKIEADLLEKNKGSLTITINKTCKVTTMGEWRIKKMLFYNKKLPIPGTNHYWVSDMADALFHGMPEQTGR